jgi:hypothetical protein
MKKEVTVRYLSRLEPREPRGPFGSKYEIGDPRAKNLPGFSSQSTQIHIAAPLIGVERRITRD